MNIYWTSLVAQMVKCLPTMWETRVRSLGWEDPLEKEMATRSSTLAWKIPWMEDPGRLQFMGSQSQTWLSDFLLYIYYIYSIHTWHRYKWSTCTSQSVFSDIKSNNSVLLWSLFSCQSTLETSHSGVEFQLGIPKSSVLSLCRRVWGGWTLFCFLRAAHILCKCCSQNACPLGKRSSPPS